MERTLHQFVLDGIAEDEATALACLQETVLAELDDWKSEHSGYSWASVDYQGRENWEHGYRWRPSQVLDECKAKRQIVELHRSDADADPDGVHLICDACLCAPPCKTMKALGSAFADREGYRDEWRP